MVSYTIPIRMLNPILLEQIDKLDAFIWTNLFCISVIDGLDYGMKVIGKNNPILERNNLEMPSDDQLLTTLSMMNYAFDKYPVFLIDPVLENLIEDTTPSVNKIRVPYPAFFINKKFPYKNGYIMGILVYELREFTFQFLLDNFGDEKKATEYTDQIANLPGMDNDLPPISFDFVYIENDTEGKVSMFVIGSDEVLNPLEHVPKEMKDLMKRVMDYSINVCNLIIMKSDLEKPMNPENDIRIIPHYRNDKDKRAKKPDYSIIRAFGVLKEYTQDYNKTKRKYRNSIESIVVRGHYRTFKSERYTKMKNETIWIPPYIKGASKELHSKLIRLQE